MGRISSHLKRLRHQLGRPVWIGTGKYRVRGYFANHLAIPDGHEPHVAAAIRRILSKRLGAFIDVGANLGQTLVKVLAIDPSRQYVGFEPQVACCHFIDQFLKDNQLSKACILPMALSDQNRIVTLFSTNQVDDQASISETPRPDGQVRPIRALVPARVGDEVLEEIGVGEIAAIKIDVEGAEIEVLRGLRGCLKTRRPDILFEVLPNFFGTDRIFRDDRTCEANRAGATELYQLLANSGYDVSQLLETGEPRPIERFDLDDRAGFIGSDFLASAKT